jgi:hypothetical protein
MTKMVVIIKWSSSSGQVFDSSKEYEALVEMEKGKMSRFCNWIMKIICLKKVWLFFGQMWNPHHKLPISQNLNITSEKIVNNMFVQNQWISRCKNGSKNTILFIYNVSFPLAIFVY